jgi:hypothetical protein
MMPRRSALPSDFRQLLRVELRLGSPRERAECGVLPRATIRHHIDSLDGDEENVKRLARRQRLDAICRG